MVSIVAFQAVDPGSTPGQRISHFFLPHCGTFYSLSCRTVCCAVTEHVFFYSSELLFVRTLILHSNVLTLRTLILHSNVLTLHTPFQCSDIAYSHTPFQCSAYSIPCRPGI